MPEDFQEIDTRSGEDADEAFERLMINMKRLNSTMLRHEVALRTAMTSLGYTLDAALRSSALK